jgi:membrane protein
VSRDEALTLAAALAYRFFLAVFPFFIFVAALGGFIAGALGVANPAEQLLRLLGDLPAGLAGPLQSELAEVLGERDPALLSVGILGALLAATTGTNAAIKAMNRAYDVEESRSFWARALLAAGTTVLSGVLLVAVFVVTLTGVALGDRLAGALGLQGVWWTVVQVARWPLAVALLLLAVAVLYKALPNVDIPWRWVAPGALLFTAAWLAATFGFALYVAHFGTYGATYGTLGGVAALLVWFYLTALALLLGAELNAILHQRGEPDELDQQRRERRSEAAGKDDAARVHQDVHRPDRWRSPAFTGRPPAAA